MMLDFFFFYKEFEKIVLLSISQQRRYAALVRIVLFCNIKRSPEGWLKTETLNVVTQVFGKKKSEQIAVAPSAHQSKSLSEEQQKKRENK